MDFMLSTGYHFKPSDIKKHPVRTYHRIIEAFKFAYKYRSLLGDPDYEKTVDKVSTTGEYWEATKLGIEVLDDGFSNGFQNLRTNELYLIFI